MLERNFTCIGPWKWWYGQRSRVLVGLMDQSKASKQCWTDITTTRAHPCARGGRCKSKMYGRFGTDINIDSDQKRPAQKRRKGRWYRYESNRPTKTIEWIEWDLLITDDRLQVQYRCIHVMCTYYIVPVLIWESKMTMISMIIIDVIDPIPILRPEQPWWQP